MQTGTKKTPDRFQNYFCPAAANDIVHHAYAWIVKEPNMQPKFLYCRAIDDPANDRGWNIIAEVWERDALGGWGISSSTMHPEFEDTSDGYALAESMPGTTTSLPYQVFREVVNEHDTNYLIALACLAAQKCVDDHNWCVENLELTEDAIMHAKPIENGSEGLPKDCWDLNPGGRPFAVTEPILHRLQSSAKLCARAGTTTQFTRMTVNQWFDKAERSQRSPLGRSVDIGRAASALNSQHEHAEVPQDLTK